MYNFEPKELHRTMRFLSCAVVGYLGEFNELELKINEDEVDQIFTVPIEELVSEKVFKQTYFRIRDFNLSESRNLLAFFFA